MDQSSKDALLANFCSISGVPEDRARFYLESANWELNVALSTFYESNDNSQESPVDDSAMFPAAPVASAASNETASAAPPATAPAKKSAPSHQSRRKFTSIHDYKDKANDDSDEDGQQQFYAGGSEHSGNMIVGPKKNKLSNKAIASNLFKQAKKHGAETVEASRAPSSSGPQTSSFQGSGYRLGDSTSGASQKVESSVKPTKKQPKSIVLRLWKNGFTVGDGELRSFHDPENADFLNAITTGRIPDELLNEDGSPVHVDMEDHRNEEYKRPKKVMVPFSGQGHTLGSTSSSMEVSEPAAPTNTNSAAASVVVDDSKPKTTIQIRLKDGTRVRKEFNHTHTVGDVHSVVSSSSATSNFVLMTTFPNRQLDNLEQTLEDAKLLNAMVVQKML